jgi:hypothetical protein
MSPSHRPCRFIRAALISASSCSVLGACDHRGRNRRRTSGQLSALRWLDDCTRRVDLRPFAITLKMNSLHNNLCREFHGHFRGESTCRPDRLLFVQP